MTPYFEYGLGISKSIEHERPSVSCHGSVSLCVFPVGFENLRGYRVMFCSSILLLNGGMIAVSRVIVLIWCIFEISLGVILLYVQDKKRGE